jgi:hypothetical protein
MDFSFLGTVDHSSKLVAMKEARKYISKTSYAEMTVFSMERSRSHWTLQVWGLP